MRKPTIYVLSALLAILLGAAWANAALSDYFASTDWLSENRGKVAVVDVRVLPRYLLGHIDGALHIDKSEFLVERRGVESLVPTAAEVAKLLEKYGIGRDTTVVAYAEDNNPYAARFVWTLRYHGHNKAYVLDGGYEKWAKESRATALLPTSYAAVAGYSVTGSQDIRAEADCVLTRIYNPSVVVWDTRRGAEYLGTEVRAKRGGHIPGAVHLEWTELQKDVNGVKVLKSEEELRSLLASKGITPDKQVIPHCQTGIRSSYATLVLLGLGYTSAKNYDGSWIEWANDPSLPIEDPATQGNN